MELPCDPMILHLGIYPKKPKTLTNSKEYMHPYVITALFTTAKIWKQPKCPSIDEWIKKKLWYTYTREYYVAVKKKELLPFVTAWMDLESIVLSEISQSKKDSTI